AIGPNNRRCSMLFSPELGVQVWRQYNQRRECLTAMYGSTLPSIKKPPGSWRAGRFPGSSTESKTRWSVRQAEALVDHRNDLAIGGGVGFQHLLASREDLLQLACPCLASGLLGEAA